MPQAASAKLQRQGELALFFVGVAFGASTPVGRELGVWFGAATVTAYRFLCALPFCLIPYLRSEHRVEVSNVRLLPNAFLYALATSTFTIAYLSGRIAVAVFGYYLANLISSLIVGVRVNREPLDRATIFAFSCSAVAVTCFAVGQQDGGAGSGWLTLGLSMVSGVLGTAMAQEQKQLGGRVDGETLTMVQICGGLIVTCVAALIVGDHSIARFNGETLWLGVLYGFLFFAINRLMVFGFKHAPVGLGTVLLSIEIVVGPVLAYLFFSETITLLEGIGGLLTACAVVATAVRKRD